MKRKAALGTFLLTVSIISSNILSATAFASDTGTATLLETGEGGVTVKKNEDSKTGYTATFTYFNDDAKNVEIQGSFTFYKPGDEYAYSGGKLNKDGDITDADHLYTPENWEPGLSRYGDSGYVKAMEKNPENGAWTISLDLPCGSYLYQYVVQKEDGSEEIITDPENIPYCNTLGASQERSQFFVPYDAEKQSESDDWTFLFPAEEESERGTLIWDTYEGYEFEGSDDSTQQVMVYLPAHYDENRSEPYKTLYLVHGGGGEEGDWFHQGNAGNITDRLAAQGDTEEMVLVAIDISEGTNEELCENLTEYTIPYVEENYNVSKEADDRSLAGLSKGAGFTYTAHYLLEDTFKYFGVFSVGYMGADYDITDAVNTGVANLYLGVGYADHTMASAFTEGQIPMAEFSESLDEKGVEYTGLTVVEGGHDWFTWPQLLKDYIESFLWK